MHLYRIRAQSVGVMTSLLCLSISTPIHAQSAGNVEAAPTVQEVVDRCQGFFATWKSARLTSEEELLSLEDGNNEWKMYGRSIGEVAWDDANWRGIKQEVFSPIGLPDTFRADYTEIVTVGDAVLTITGKGHTPTREEVASGDFSPFDELGDDFLVLLYEGSSASERRGEFDPRIPLLTGYHKEDATPQATLLNEFRGARQCRIAAVTMLDRQCWQVTTVGASETGTFAMTICPDLGYAPIEIRAVRGSNDRHWNGKRVGDIELDGKRLQSTERVTTLEAVNPDWTEFTIRSVARSTYRGEGQIGRGVVTRYGNIQRPATKTALQVESAIKNGSPVVLMDNQQIKAEWHDGKVVRMYDGEAVKELASVEMKPARFGTGRILAVAGLLAGAVVGLWRWKLRKQNPIRLGKNTRP